MEINKNNVKKAKLEIINKYFKKEFEIKKEEINKEANMLVKKFNKEEIL